jgi:F-type H+-transporting ATPase subunit gamma
MAKINEIKEQQIVVRSVGDFANSLQQIATMRMTSLRKSVLASRAFVDEATLILRELKKEKSKQVFKQLRKVDHKFQIPLRNRKAVIVVSSYQGLCGSYNTEIIKKLETVLPDHIDADFFVIGSKGQEYFRKQVLKNPSLKFYPYDVPEDVQIEDLRKLITMFTYYDEIFLIYSKFINTTTREVVFLKLAEPAIDEEEEQQPDQPKKDKNKAIDKKLEGKFIFEPSIDEIIQNITDKLRYALFRQQILDSKLALYTAQMVAMQTASDNAKDLMKTLQLEYNKARRKMIDKKIQEVQAGRALWS